MRRAILILTCAGLALAACTDSADLPTEPQTAAPEAAAPLFTVNTLTGDTEVDPSGVSGDPSYVFPSTNEANYAAGWAHVLFVDVAVEQVTLEFVSLRGFYSCFEYRIDDEAPTSSANGGVNYNTDITDGMWSFTCQNASSGQLTFTAADHVDIRMGFGAERDERFDWTRFYVLSLANKDQCRDGDWQALGFKSQGQCVRYVETGKDSRTGG